MSTTVKALGGGAQPASIDTSGKVTGGPALRVYGFDSEADALAAGYVCEGGPAMSVALITDAQIASGDWKAQGDPAALVIYTAPDNMPIEGGYSVPVYPVNGWGSAPAPSDPIGDGLRTDAVAYWTMDEASGTRADSTGHTHSLTIGADPVGSTTGKVGNAAVYVSDSNNADTPYLINSDPVNLQDFCVAQWVYVETPAHDFEATLFDVGPLSYFYINIYKHAIQTPVNGFLFADTETVGVLLQPLTFDEWHLVIAWRSNNQTFFQIDNNAPISQAAVTTIWTDTIITGIAIDSAVTFYQDEVLLLNRAPTSDERDYLWNSGAGRTLYP